MADFLVNLLSLAGRRPRNEDVRAASELHILDSADESSSPPRNQHKSEAPHRMPAKLEETPLTRTERDLCRIQKFSQVPLGGDLRLQSVERSEGGRNYWIKSSNCPDELYSIVSMDSQGRIEKEIDCQTASLTEVTLNSGLQFAIEVARPDLKVRSMALSGPGRFLVNCWDGGLSLTRDGRFNQESAALINGEGCTAWTKRDGGRPVRLASDEVLDQNGCSEKSRECLEIFEIDASDKDAFNFKSKNSVSILNNRGLMPARQTVVVHDSFEDLDSIDRSLTGVENWEHLPPTRLHSHCPE